MGKLKVISWNARGVATHIEHFLEVLSTEVEWDYLLIQEFSGSMRQGGNCNWTTRDGHQVFQQAPCPGKKIGGIIVHAKNIFFTVNNSFVSCGRAWSLDVQLPDFNYYRLVGAHMDPSTFGEGWGVLGKF